MEALGNVLEDEVLTLHCHENGDCHEPDDRHSERSRVSELVQSADGCQSHAFRPNSIIAKMPRPLVGAMTKMMLASSAS